MVISDNGASAEGGVTGSFNEMLLLQPGARELRGQPRADRRPRRPGGLQPLPVGLGVGRATRRSGAGSARPTAAARPTRSSWPGRRGSQARGEVRTQYAHAIDMVPTVLDALGDRAAGGDPRRRADAAGGRQLRAHVRRRPTPRRSTRTQYFEMFGHRSIYHDGWRAVCPWPGAELHRPRPQLGRKLGDPITPEVLEELDRNVWELYDMTADPTESRERRGRAPRAAARADRALVGGGREVQGAAARRLDAGAAGDGASADLQAARRATSTTPAARWCRPSRRRWSTTARTRSRPTSRSPTAAPRACSWPRAATPAATPSTSKDGELRFLYNYVGLDRFEVRRRRRRSDRGPPRAALRVRADRRARHRQRQGRPGARPALHRRRARRRDRVPAHDAAVLRARRAQLRLRLRRPGGGVRAAVPVHRHDPPARGRPRRAS